MKLFNFFAAPALCKFSKEKSEKMDRFGMNPVPEMTQCDFNSELDPVISVFSAITNKLGPDVITNIFLDNFENENVIISPVSMASQLTLLQEGAGGETKRQLESVTLMPEHGGLEAIKEMRKRYDCITKGKIHTKNAIFLDNTFNPKPEFYHNVKSTDSDIFKLNFATQSGFARSIIEKWASLEENDGFEENFIPEDSLSEETSMLLYSSMHFSSKWAVRFEESHPGGFLLPDGTTKMVDMMGLKINLPHIFSCSDFPQNPNCLSDELVPSMISLPLEDPRLQITIFMANEKLPVGAILAMSGKWMPYWQFLAEGNFGEIQIRVPKLDVASQKDITNALFGVGIQDAFDPFMANFTRITDKIGISASNIFQRNYLKWDLDGASAGQDMVSSLKLSARGYSYDEIDQFNVDRPFVFVISDRTTESNLFMGVINDPRV